MKQKKNNDCTSSETHTVPAALTFTLLLEMVDASHVTLWRASPQDLFLSLNYMFSVISWPPCINKAVPPVVAHITPFTTQRPTIPIEICPRRPTRHALNLVPPYAIIGGSSEHLQDQPRFASMWLNCFGFLLCTGGIQSVWKEDSSSRGRGLGCNL